MSSKIQKASQAINSFTEYSTTHLKNTAAKVIGLISLLVGLGVFAAAAYSLYLFALDINMPTWHGVHWLVIIPYGFFTLMVLILAMGIGGFPIVYGAKMLQANLKDAKNPVAVEGDL